MGLRFSRFALTAGEPPALLRASRLANNVSVSRMTVSWSARGGQALIMSIMAERISAAVCNAIVACV
jgi:hypothetical protein